MANAQCEWSVVGNFALSKSIGHILIASDCDVLCQKLTRPILAMVRFHAARLETAIHLVRIDQCQNVAAVQRLIPMSDSDRTSDSEVGFRHDV